MKNRLATVIWLVLVTTSVWTWVGVQSIQSSASKFAEQAEAFQRRVTVPDGQSYTSVKLKNPEGVVTREFTSVTNYVIHDGYVTFHGHEEGGDPGEQDQLVGYGAGWTLTCA